MQNPNLHAHTHGRQRSSATRSAHAKIACRLQEQRSSGRPSHLRHPRTPKTHFLRQLDNISTLPLLSHSFHSTVHSTSHHISYCHSAHLSCGLMMFRSPSSCPKMIFWRSKRSIRGLHATRAGPALHRVAVQFLLGKAPLRVYQRYGTVSMHPGTR